MALSRVEDVQVKDLDAIVVPVSGGGMISGVAVAAKGLNPAIRIIGAEPTGGSNSLKRRVAFDAALPACKGSVSFPACQSACDGCLMAKPCLWEVA